MEVYVLIRINSDAFFEEAEVWEDEIDCEKRFIALMSKSFPNLTVAEVETAWCNGGYADSDMPEIIVRRCIINKKEIL